MIRRTCAAVLTALLFSSIATAQAKWRLVEDLRIGGGEDGPTSFSRIGALDVDRQGRIAVYDAAAPELRLFDATGKFVRAVGRKGQGPGEFTETNGVRFRADGSLWVNDWQNTRIVGFDAKGDFLKQYIVPVWGYAFRWDAIVDRQGRIVETFSFTTPPAPGAQRTRKLRRLDPMSGKLDTVDIPACLPSDENPRKWSRQYEVSGGRGFAQVPFAPTSSERIDPEGGFACARGDEYRATIINYTTGVVVTDIRTNTAAVSIPDAKRDSAVKAVHAPRGRFTPPAGTVALSDVPATYPRIEQFDIDDMGRLWIRRESPSGLAIDVWGRDGKQIATLDAPVRFFRYDFLILRGDRVYAVVPDKDDVPFIVRYRIAR